MVLKNPSRASASSGAESNDVPERRDRCAKRRTGFAKSIEQRCEDVTKSSIQLSLLCAPMERRLREKVLKWEEDMP